MIKLLLLMIGLSFNLAAYSAAGHEYMQRFTQFQTWNEHLPSKPDNTTFINFINSKAPLAVKLRERWLYKLAQNKDWANYYRYYQHSNDLSLRCYQQIARIHLGFIGQAVHDAKLLWLTGNELPPSCDAMYSMLRKDGHMSDTLINQRIILALDNKNIKLALYLLKQFAPMHQADLALLEAIDKHPASIIRLTPGFLHGEFFLYGAKKLVARDMDNAIILANHARSHQIINEGQYQAFLAQVALYKAMRDAPDTLKWFAKVQRAYYNDVLLDWEIRYALKHRQWNRVESLIRMNRNIDTPCWQYWLARALEKRGDYAKANEIYEKVARLRQYYGFLASLRIHKSPNFSNEYAGDHSRLLIPYRPFTNNIKALYQNNQIQQASRLLNDFISELTKQELSALTNWLSNELKWQGKAVMLSNDNRLLNQLSLRFPTPHYQSVSIFSHHYRVPQEFVYAIMRQESGFRPDVVSPAGAHGLMQLMPQTAKLVAKQKHIELNNNNELFISHTNINLGVAYLQQLSSRFQNHPVLMAAAYNAGPGQVNNWIKSHPPEQIDIWIESIPWHETRNYLKNIVAFYAVYQYRIKGKPDLTPFMQPFRR